ncbi:MAG: OsmC family peroxiredoxin [Gemmatimonadota bacterium]
MALKAESKAEAFWTGNLAEGSGTVRMKSGAAPEMAVSWAARTVRSTGITTTSPEELIAAAHAACFCMALSNGLNQKGHPPRQLDVSATCTFEVDQGASIKSMQLQVTGDVPGMDQAAFAEAANAAKDGCPVSKALKGNVDVQVEAKLKG